MKYTPKPPPIWLDIREKLACYSAEEMLLYYRSAKIYCSSDFGVERTVDAIYICSKLCMHVDSVLAAMSCDYNFRVSQMARLLEMEFCKPQTDIATKISACGIGRTTYYNYLKNGKIIFGKLSDIMLRK